MKDDMTDDSYDFGEDDGVVPASDPRFDAWIAKAAATLNAPGAIPRAEMWSAIQAARNTAHDAQAGRVPGVLPLRRNPWRLVSVIAAALLLGVAFDRLILERVERADVASVPAASTAPTDTSDVSHLYRMVAGQTLTQAEALLTAYRAGGVAERDPATAAQMARWGRDILGSTRLLLDSPAGKDPQLRSLLLDLELVVVQIILRSGAPLDVSDRGLIDRAIEDRNLLPRIRSAVPAGPIAAGAD